MPTDPEQYIKVGDLAVVYGAMADPPEWYVANADGIIVLGPFSNLEAAMEAAKRRNASGTASENPSS
jgi:hypothetical protein